MQNINRHTEEDGIQTSDLANIERLHQDNNEKLVTKRKILGEYTYMYIQLFAKHAIAAAVPLHVRVYSAHLNHHKSADRPTLSSRWSTGIVIK